MNKYAERLLTADAKEALLGDAPPAEIADAMESAADRARTQQRALTDAQVEELYERWVWSNIKDLQDDILLD